MKAILIVVTALFLACNSLPQGATTQDHSNDSQKMTDKKYYQLVMLWINDPATFNEYAQKVAPIVARYGGAAENVFLPEVIYAEGVEKPHMVNFVYYDSKEAYQQMLADKDFQEVVPLRDQSVKLMSCEGYLTQNKPNSNPNDRVYNIEIASYKDGDASLYRKYEELGEGAMSQYGYEVNYLMDIDDSSGMQGDFMKISSWGSSDQIKNFEKDEMHGRIEKELYPPAIENLIWITGKVHPVMLSAK